MPRVAVPGTDQAPPATLFDRPNRLSRRGRALEVALHNKRALENPRVPSDRYMRFFEARVDFEVSNMV